MEGLTLDPSDPIFKLIVDIPDFNSNPVGSVARNALVNKLKLSTPGRHSEPWPQPAGSRFVDIFFPNTSSVPYEGDVTGQTGLSDGFWSDFAVAVLCQSMYWQTSDIRGQLLIDKINADVGSYNTSLQGKAVQWYSHVLLQDFMKYSGDFGQAIKTYIYQLCTERWVTYKMKQYNDGTWLNPDWEEFHHWAKLSALGASDDEISGVINKLRGLGLRIFPDVDVSTWRNYFVWYKPDSLDHKDVDADARNGELEEVCTSYSGSSYPSCMKEENSFEFTADSQPGNKYRQVPSSSCFSPTTKVLMSDGSLKEIRKVAAGEMIQTPSGPRQVLLVATPMRNERPLYGINGQPDFLYTATHPFINFQESSSMEPHFLAVSPLELTHAIPIFSYDGIKKLERGSCLVGFTDGSPHKIPILSIEEFPAGPNEELLYDLILEPDYTGQFEYIVGGKDSLFVVASELSTFKNATRTELVAGAVILHAISSASDSLFALHKSTNMYLFREKLTKVAHQLSAYLLPQTSRQTGSTSGVLSKLSEPAHFIQYVKSKINAFVLSSGTYNPATGEAYACISARVTHQLACTLQLGYRIIRENTDVDCMAVSLGDVHITGPLPPGVIPDPVIVMQVDEFPQVKHKVEGNSVPFGVRIHHIFYIPLQDLRKEYTLKLHIENAMSQEKVLECCTQVVLPLNHSYRNYRLPLFFSQEEKGFLHMDIHLLSTANAEAEKIASQSWNADSMYIFAEQLMMDAGEILIKLCQQEVGESPVDHAGNKE